MTLAFHPDVCVLFGMLVCYVCICVCVCVLCVCAHVHIQSINGHINISLGRFLSGEVWGVRLITSMILLELSF